MQARQGGGDTVRQRRGQEDMTVYKCPGCGNAVEAPAGLQWEIGCMNTEEHDQRVTIIMHEQVEA